MSTTQKQTTPSGPAMMVEELEKAGRPMAVRELTSRVLKRAPAKRILTGKTPHATLSAKLSVSDASGSGPFVKVEPGVFGLRSWPTTQRKLSPITANGTAKRGNARRSPSRKAGKATRAKAPAKA